MKNGSNQVHSIMFSQVRWFFDKRIDLHPCGSWIKFQKLRKSWSPMNIGQIFSTSLVYIVQIMTHVKNS